MNRTAGAISYELTRKNVKNLNLRIQPDGTVRVSANPRVPLEQIDAFVLKNEARILAAITALQNRPQTEEAIPQTNAECLQYFERFSAKIFPLFRDVLTSPPTLAVRDMKTRWGVCNIAKHRITFNKRLMTKPPELIEYVMLHEYAHFIHPNHQRGFHELMARLMPDYKQRRNRLNGRE